MRKEYLAQIMAALAFETGLHVKDGKYYDEDGNQWVIGKHGFNVKTPMYCKVLAEDLPRSDACVTALTHKKLQNADCPECLRVAEKLAILNGI